MSAVNEAAISAVATDVAGKAVIEAKFWFAIAPAKLNDNSLGGGDAASAADVITTAGGASA